MKSSKKKEGIFAGMTGWQKIRLSVSGIALILLTVWAYFLYHPRDPLAELKRTEVAEVKPEAQAVIDRALNFIEAKNFGREGLFSVFATRDIVMYGVEYTDPQTGLFSPEKPDFAPVEVTEESRRLVHSSLEHVFVRLHSIPRQEDYWIVAVRLGGTYKIDSICKAR